LLLTGLSRSCTGPLRRQSEINIALTCEDGG
jgi:hypothetical protein